MESFNLQVVAPGQPALLTAEGGYTCRFIKPPAPFGETHLTTVDPLGKSVPVTTLECTVADLFDRPDLAGGTDELISSLNLIGRLDPDRLITRRAALGNASAAGAGGWWLEHRRAQLDVSADTLDRLQALAPKQNRYALGAISGNGRLAPRRRVILPEAVLHPAFERLGVMPALAQTLQRLANETGLQASMLEKVLSLLDVRQEVARGPILADRLALKGGTALNVFHLALDRLSINISLNYVGALERAALEADGQRSMRL